jgi:hypothetical protein
MNRTFVKVKLFSVVFLLILATCSFTQPAERSVQLLFTSDVYGYIEPCG